jgi:hypothetical protein
LSAPRLHPEDLEILADLIAGRLADRLDGIRPAPQLVDAAEVARRFGVSPDWIYEHSSELGVIRLGDGPRARLRFDPAKVAEALGAGERPGRSAKPSTTPGRRRRRAKSTDTTGASLLPIRGEEP